MRALALSSLLLSAFVTTACGALAPALGDPGTRQPVEVVVENRGMEDVTVHLVRGSTPVLLGVVMARQTRRFELNRAVLGSGSDLSLSARDCVGPDAHRSTQFHAAPGNRVEWTVEVRLQVSQLSIL